MSRAAAESSYLVEEVTIEEPERFEEHWRKESLGRPGWPARHAATIETGLVVGHVDGRIERNVYLLRLQTPATIFGLPFPPSMLPNT